MNQSRTTHIDSLPYRPMDASIESKKDRYGRITFRMPEVRSLSALEIPMKEELMKIRRVHALRPGKDRGKAPM